MTNKTDLDVRLAIITAILQRPVNGGMDLFYMHRDADEAYKWVMEDRA